MSKSWPVSRLLPMPSPGRHAEHSAILLPVSCPRAKTRGLLLVLAGRSLAACPTEEQSDEISMPDTARAITVELDGRLDCLNDIRKNGTSDARAV